MPIRPYHDTDLPQKLPVNAGKTARVIAVIIGAAAVGLVLGYR